jgi:glyoxylate reductase
MTNETKKVLVTREIPEAGLKMLRKRKDIRLDIYKGSRAIPRNELLSMVGGCSAILSLLTDEINEEVLDAAGPNLRVVANYAVGYDNIDILSCADRGIAVANTPGVVTDAVAEHTIALITSLVRRIPESDRFVRSGKYRGWEPMLFLGSQIKDKTLGIIGLGRIGREVAERAVRGLGMEILYFDTVRDRGFERKYRAKRAKIDTIMKKADVISIQVPLMPSTHHLIDSRRLNMMKKTAYLINTSRGPIIDEQALLSALKKERIAGAALDVFENEPNISLGLTKLDNVILTPHIASATTEARSAMAILAAGAIIAVLDGRKPENIVTVNHK